MKNQLQAYQNNSFQLPSAEHPNLRNLQKTINQETIQKKVATERINKLFLDGKLKQEKLENILKQRNEGTDYNQSEIVGKSKVNLNNSVDMMMGRSYQWNEHKINKLQGQIKKKQAEDEQLLIEQTSKLSFVNQNIEKESKVRIHIDALENKALEKKNRVVQKDPNCVAENEPLQPARQLIDLLGSENQRKRQVFGFMSSVSVDKKVRAADTSYHFEFEKTKTMKWKQVK